MRKEIEKFKIEGTVRRMKDKDKTTDTEVKKQEV